MALVLLASCTSVPEASDYPWSPMCPPGIERIPKTVFGPIYPRRALIFGTEGWVVLQLEVGEDGRVDHVEVRESYPRGYFEQASLEAVKRWRYFPVGDEECRHLWVKLQYAREGSQMAESTPTLQAASSHFAWCELSAAAAAARRARSSTQNPHIFMAAALIEAAGLEIASPGSATELLEAYVKAARDIKDVESARRRALNLVPEYCLE